MASGRPRHYGSRCVPGVLSAFSNPVEGCLWRHEGHGDDPFPGQHALEDATQALLVKDIYPPWLTLPKAVYYRQRHQFSIVLVLMITGCSHCVRLYMHMYRL